MSLSLHEVSLAVMSRMLRNLSQILEKGAAHAAAKGTDPNALLDLRLVPDMLPLKVQIFIAADMAKGCAARLAGEEVPSWPDTETTLADLQARIAKTIAYLDEFGPARINGAEDREIVLQMRNRDDLHFTGRAYVLNFVIPNFYFHVTTTYALLRADGVELGKGDFIGA